MKLIREPVLIANLVKAVLMALIAFGVTVTADQQSAVLGLVAAVIAVAAILIPAKFERDAVTPVAAPRLPEDTVVEVTDKETGEVTAENVTQGA